MNSCQMMDLPDEFAVTAVSYATEIVFEFRDYMGKSIIFLRTLISDSTISKNVAAKKLSASTKVKLIFFSD